MFLSANHSKCFLGPSRLLSFFYKPLTCSLFLHQQSSRALWTTATKALPTTMHQRYTQLIGYFLFLVRWCTHAKYCFNLDIFEVNHQHFASKFCDHACWYYFRNHFFALSSNLKILVNFKSLVSAIIITTNCIIVSFFITPCFSMLYQWKIQISCSYS